MLIKKKKKKIFCINYNTNFCSSPGPDPWSDSVSSSHNVLLANDKKILMWLFYLGTSQLSVFQKFGTIGLAYQALQSWDFRFFMNFFFTKSQKKIFFFLFWLKLSLYLFLVWLEKNVFLPALEGFFANFFGDFSIIFDDFFSFIFDDFFQFFCDFFNYFFNNFWWIFWWFFNNFFIYFWWFFLNNFFIKF